MAVCCGDLLLMIRPPRPCTYPGCAAVTTTGRCPKHPPALWRNRVADREYNQRRPESDRFYGTAAWVNLRAMVLSQSPICVECERLGRVTLATVVDHIIPFKERPDLGMTIENLRPLCSSCHNRIGKRIRIKATEESESRSSYG